MNNSKQYLKEKRRVLKSLETILEIFGELNRSDLKEPLFSQDEIDELSDIYERSLLYHKKIESDSFEIAIVGLEKAGKSTFANALIDNSILPSAPERCTFTSTSLVYGDNRATVHLYTKEEFNSIFQTMLKDIEFPNYSNEDFSLLDLERFNSFFDHLKDKNANLYNLHIGRTDEEIREIIKFRDSLLLTGDRFEFLGDELLSEKFQEYIRGEKLGIEVNTAKPRSVKSLSIESSRLSKMKSATIFDVPGFDSPTKIHEIQTLKRLKRADAIILVTNVGDRPNITAPQLDALRKESDSDGIKLSEKLFIFGNKLDTANSLHIAENNRKHLINDVVNRYKIAEEKRVFVGSALKHLVDISAFNEESYNKKFEINSGIEEIRKELINYYENERFEILKRKVEIIVGRASKLLFNILKKENSFLFLNSEEAQRNLVSRRAFKEIESRLQKNLLNLKMELKREIFDKKYFTNRFKEETLKTEYFEKIDETIFDEVEIVVNNSLTTETPVERVNHGVREIIHSRYLMEFTNLIKFMTDKKSKEIDRRVLDLFIDGIVGDEISLSDEVEDDVKRFISSLTDDISHNEGRFFYLIDRFARDLFDVLLLYPVKSADRTKKFEASGVEFQFLDNYFNNGDGSLLNLILAQREGKSTKNILDIIKNATRGSTKSSVINEINMDIENLKTILTKGIIQAINLEVAFLNSIDKKIKILLSSFNRVDSEESLAFDEFIAKVVPKVKERELEAISYKVREAKEIERVIELVKNSYPKLS